MDFRLFINKQVCDLDDAFAVQLSYTAEDTTDPSAVLTEYSKTITLKRTANNDLIFNFIGDLNRVQANEEGYYNPMERMPMTLYYRDSVVLDGYAKLESVNVDSYSVSLYSGVADFFYSLSTDTDGDTFTLDRLGFETNLDFVITKEAVKEAWDRLKSNKTGISKWDSINFAPMYNGLPENMDANKALLNISGSSVFSSSTINDGGTTYSTYQNSMLALGEFSKEHSEWEVGDLRSYCQRPILNIKKMFEAIQRTAEGKGYNLILDKGFFNDLNPYYSKSWMTLPMLTQLEMEGQTWTGNCNYTQSVSFKPEALNETGIDFSGQLNGAVVSMPNVNGKSNLHIKFSLSADINYSGSELFTGFLMHNYDDDRPSDNFTDAYTQWNNNGVAVQFYLKDFSTDSIIAASPTYTLASLIDGRMKRCPSPVGYGTAQAEVAGTFKYSGGEWKFTGAGNNTEFEAVIEDIPKVREMYLTMAVYSHSRKLWPRNEYWLNTFEIGKDIINLKSATESGELEFNSFGKTGSNATIGQRALFNGMGSVADYLIGYAKMFGLKWLQEGKTIHLMTRNKYYTKQIIDYTEDSDRADLKLTPLVYNKRYFDLKNQIDASALSEKYTNDWGADYGRQRIDTGYRFDSDVEDFFKDLAYKGGVYGKLKSNYFRHIKGMNWTEENKEWIPSPIMDKITYSLVKNGNDPDDTKSIDAGMEVIKYINFNATPRYDSNDRMCFADGDGGAVDGDSVLLFFDGFKEQKDANGYDIDYMLTDDIEEMFALNGDNATWLITPTELVNDRRIAYKYNSLPNFSRYFTNGTNSIVLSMDMGEPRELYCSLASSSSATIYNRFWRNYLRDQMNVDTRKVNVPLLFRTGMDRQTLRDFVRIDEQVYMLNSADFNVGSTGTTSAELIKINDMNNYTQGQTLLYPEASLAMYGSDEVVEYIGGQLKYYVEAENIDGLHVVCDGEWCRAYIREDYTGKVVIIDIDPNNAQTERQCNVWLAGRDLGGFEVVGNAVAVKQGFHKADRRTMRFTIVSGDTWNNTHISAYTADNRMISPTTKTQTGWTYGEDVAYLQTNGQAGYSLTSYSGFEDKVEYRNMYYFFAYNPKCETIETARMDVSKCTDMESTFERCGGLTSLDLSNWDTSQVANMKKTFSMCSNLASMDVSNFNTSKVEDMTGLFNACSKLTSIDVSRWDTSKVKNMSSMFGGCSGLTSLDVSHFNTSQCSRMDNMFNNCKGLTSLDVSHFDTSKCNTMPYMFSNCSNLTSLNVSNWNVSRVIGMRLMFWKCEKLKTLDLSNWDISNVTGIDGLFEGCSSLETLDLSNWNINENAVVDDMFKGCSSLSQIIMRNCDARTIRLINFALSNAGILNQVTIITE